MCVAKVKGDYPFKETTLMGSAKKKKALKRRMRSSPKAKKALPQLKAGGK